MSSRVRLLFFLLVMRTSKNYSLSSFSTFQICNTIVLTVVSELSIRWGSLTYLIIGTLYLFLPLPFYLPSCYLWQPLISSLYLCAFFFFKDSTYKWDHMIFVFVWLFLSLSIKPSIPFMLSEIARLHYFYGWIIFYCI